MRRFKNIGILQKLISINSAFVFLFLSVLVIVFYIEEKDRFVRDVEKTGMMIAKNLAHNASLAVLSKNKEAMERYVDGVFKIEDVVRVAVYCIDGTLFVERDREGFKKQMDEGFLSSIIDRRKISSRIGDDVLTTFSPVQTDTLSGGREEIGLADDLVISEGGEGALLGYLVVSLSTTSLRARLMELGTYLAGLVFVFYLLGMMIMLPLMRRFVRPVLTIAKAARRIANGDLDIKVDVDSEDEVGLMARDFNQMVDSLKKTISKVREGAMEIENLLEGAREGIFILDEHLVITKANREIARLLGFSEGEITGKHITDILMPQFWNSFEGMLPLGKPMMKETSMRDKKGNVILFEINFMPMVSNDRNVILAFARDISERKKLEESLINAERLAATGRLAADIAHEVNNPLGIIKNYLAISKREMKENDKDISGNLDIIDEEINRIAKIIKGILDFSRPVVEEVHPCDVNEVIEQIVELSKQSLGSQKIRVDIELNPSLKEVGISSDHLKQVLINLMNNSMDAMPAGGELMIRTMDGHNGVEVIVEDSGTGINEDLIGKVFTPFHTTKGVKGTGLGLSVSYGLIKGCSGEISLNNKKNGGVRATLFLPYARGGAIDG